MIYGVSIKLQILKKNQLDYCKNLLVVKQYTTNVVIYFELGRYPLIYNRMYRILKYWLKLLSTNNCFKLDWGCHLIIYLLKLISWCIQIEQVGSVYSVTWMLLNTNSTLFYNVSVTQIWECNISQILLLWLFFLF